jgi:hypothetical protein
MLFRTVGVWLIILVVAVLNGGVREILVAPRFGAATGHIVSTIILSTVIFLAAQKSISWIDPKSASDAFAVGMIWLLLTLAFEFLAGHYLFGTPWDMLLADYDVVRGRIWVLVLMSTLLAPMWAWWQRA